MGLNSISSHSRGALSTWQTLELANFYLDYALKTTDLKLALMMCGDAESALSHVKRTAKWAPKYANNQDLRNGIAAAYSKLGRLQDYLEQNEKAQASYKSAEKWGFVLSDKDMLDPAVNPLVNGPTPLTVGQHKQHYDIATIPPHIFPLNVRPPAIEFKLPEADERLSSTPQLVCCLALLKTCRSNDEEETLKPAALKWLRATEEDTNEQERLYTMAKEVIKAFKRDELKDAKTVAEVVCLAPILDKDTFRDLLKELYSGIDRSGLLDFYQLEGIAQLIEGADTSYLDADDLVKILGLLSTRLRETHQQSTHHVHQLTLAVSHVLDAMADTKVHGLDREKLHEPLLSYLERLKRSSDPFLVYQAAYAFQALLCVPDNETTWQAAMRHTKKLIQGVSGLVTAVKGLDLVKFIQGLEDIEKGFAGAFKAVDVVKTTYHNVASLVQSGQDFLYCLEESFSFKRKSAWYTALRGADTLIQYGELATFRKLVCEAPCRRDPAFQWGVCQRLGEIAASLVWDAETRRTAVAFLGEIYRNDAVWGQQANVKHWILNILMQLASSSGKGSQVHATVAETLLQELEADSNAEKQELYRARRENGPCSHPLKIALPDLASPSLLYRVQNRPDVEGNLRLLRKQRLKGRGNAVYILPQAKASLQAPDDARFPLMEKVKEFFDSKQKVFLLLGDSGAGKSTFNQELESDLWEEYKNKTGRIPLYINLPAIEKPEHDMIAKQLRKAEFAEPQIRELKIYRKFILICDGYDESQQTHNLYMSNRLNQPGEWNAQMVISCRSEYLGLDYRDRFQPGDRNHQSEPSLFQEAVIAPFSLDQVQAYIKQYVSVHQPMWQTEDYKQALELIPSLRDLVKNPFLMTLSLEVLPRMVDPGQHLSTAHVTRVALYDQFIEQWLERGKKRLGEKDLGPQARAVFESLSDEGFTQNGIDFLKKLAVAIYKKQGGQPVVEYSRFKDEGSWKDEFFRREDKQLLREACPLTRNGNQYRFIHRSLLEYGLARAAFDPNDGKKTATLEQTSSRRGSVSSALSFEILNTEEETATIEHEPDPNSPLVWRNFVNDHSLLQFLQERVQQEPVFKQRLLAYIEHSKMDKKWRAAAANAITILVRAGVQFISANLRGIRIPGADLSYGVFDSAQLQDADLRKVNLRGVWLRQTDLSRAQMTGVQFGELPFLTEETEVQSCTYSQDGKSFAIGLVSGNITVYTTSNWERVRTWRGHSGSVRGLVYSPTGDQIVSASEDKTVRLWDTETGDCRPMLTDHDDMVSSVAYSPQGIQIASASGDKSVKLWDVATRHCELTLSGHTDEVLSVAYSPNGRRVVSGSMDCTVRIWDTKYGTCCRILEGHKDNVWSVVYSPHGDMIASASDDATLRLWDAESGSDHHVLYGHNNDVFSVAYSPKGDQIASGGQDGTVRLWDVETGACRQTFTGHSGSVASVVFSPKGDQVASGCWDRTVRLWGVSAATSSYVSNGHSVGVLSVECSPRQGQIASCSIDSTIRLWDIETGACLRVITGHRMPVCCVAYSPQGDQIASAGNDRTVQLWDVEAGECRRILTKHTDDVNSVAYSPQGDLLISGSSDKTIRLWDVATGECCGLLIGHTDEVLGVSYSPKGDQIASCSSDHTIRMWEIRLRDVKTEVTEVYYCLRTLTGHHAKISSVTYSPRGDQLASAGGDQTVRLWNTETGDCDYILIGHSGQVCGLAYSRKGELLASGSEDKTVRFWDVATGQCRGVTLNFQSDVYSISWSISSSTSSSNSTTTTGLDINQFVTGCGDGSVLMWEIVEKEKEEQKQEQEQEEQGDLLHARLRWSSTNGALTVTGASIQDVNGLTQLNSQLLKQREAIGEPIHVLHGASKNLLRMVSVVSKFKQPSSSSNSSSSSSRLVLDSLSTSRVGEQLG